MLNNNQFYSTILLFFSCTILFSCKTANSIKSNESINFYIGTNSGDPQEGIYTYKMNLKNGQSEMISKYPNILNPGYLALSNDGNNLYAIHSIKDEKESGLSAFKINKNTGTLELINHQSTGGRGGCHISVTAEDDVVVANYSSGSIAFLPTQKDGSLAKATSKHTHSGSSVNKDRQKGPHAHFIQQGVGGLFYAVDLGIDKIMLYKQVNDELVANNPPSIDMHPGAGPRHVDFHPNGKYVYVINELEGSVTGLKYNGNNQPFEVLQTISSLPNGFADYNKSADIHIHPSGKYLYASNRGDHNSIAVYQIDQNTGSLSLVEIENEAVAWPRNFALSPDGRFLLCANRDTDSVTFYDVDLKSGELKYTGKKVYAPKPICVKFDKL